MKSFVIKKAVRSHAKMRIGISGTAGSGKTWSSLLIAKGLSKTGKIGLIDTENGSGSLYSHLCDYDLIELKAPYLISDYIGALDAFIAEGYEVVIIDSLTHAWAGVGGLLDKHAAVTAASKDKNSYNAWRLITPEHNSLVDKMLSAPLHIIATMRSKTEYVSEKNEQGKNTYRKVGLAPIQRDGMEYEFTLMLDIDQDSHYARASKDRTSLFDGIAFLPDQSTGEKIKKWAEMGLSGIETSIVLKAKELNLDIETTKERLLNEWLKPAYLKAKEPLQINSFSDIPEKHVSALLQKLPEKIAELGFTKTIVKNYGEAVALVAQINQTPKFITEEQAAGLENQIIDLCLSNSLAQHGVVVKFTTFLNEKYSLEMASLLDLPSSLFEEINGNIEDLFKEAFKV